PQPKLWVDHRTTVFQEEEWAIQDRVLANRPNLVTGDNGAGKTTYSLNEAVCVGAGIPFLGFKTKRMPVFLLLGEDKDAHVRNSLERIRQTLGIDDDVTKYVTWFCTLDLKLPHGPGLVRITDDGEVQQSQFWLECIQPRLLAYNGPVLFNVDPAIVY